MLATLKRNPVATLAVVTVLVTGALVVTAGVAGNGDPLIRVSIPAAFLGGVLSLLSPCSAALLPAFFAVSFRERGQLVKMMLLFWLGLATVFVPLGFGTTVISHAVVAHRGAFLAAAGVIFMLIGAWAILGPIILPTSSGGLRTFGKGPFAVYLTGLLFSFTTGTCAAPVIGGIFTLAATSGSGAYAFLLLFLYSLGLVAPLFVLAWSFEKGGVMRHPIIRGKLWTWTVGGRTIALHSTEVLSGVMFLLLGLVFLFLRTDGSLTALFGRTGISDLYYRLSASLVGTR